MYMVCGDALHDKYLMNSCMYPFEELSGYGNTCITETFQGPGTRSTDMLL